MFKMFKNEFDLLNWDISSQMRSAFFFIKKHQNQTNQSSGKLTWVSKGDICSASCFVAVHKMQRWRRFNGLPDGSHVYAPASRAIKSPAAFKEKYF